MATSKEYIDYNFKPRLRKLLYTEDGGIDIDTAYLLEMPDHGTPAPTLNGHKSAVWVGSAVNAHEESPVMALVVAPGESANSPTSRWYVGIVAVADLVNAEEIMNSIAPRPAFVLQAAQHAVLPTRMDDDNVAARASDAVELLCAIYLR